MIAGFTPQVTVLMPVYNGEAFLGEAIESILAQTRSDFEFLIIDDGSTDSSLEIAGAYRDPRIRLVRNEKNLGLELTLNKGLGLARGAYVARMDCDDISLPQRLEKQVAFLEQNRSVAVLGTQAEVFGSSSHVTRNPLAHEEICCRQLFSCAIVHPSVLIRKELLLENNLLYDTTGTHRRAEDYDLWVRISRSHRLANLGEVFLRHRIHESNVGQKYTAHQIAVADRIRERQLGELGIAPSEEERSLHSLISRGEYQKDLLFLRRSEAWLLRIADANHASRLCDADALGRELAFHWWRICSGASSLGLKAFLVYAGSALPGHFSNQRGKVVKFFLRSVIRHGSR